MTMKAATASTHAIPQGGEPSDDSAPAGQSTISIFSTLIESVLGNIWELMRDHLLLVALESQRAGRSILRMVFGAVVVAVLLVTGWLALVASAMFWIVAADASWARAFLAVGLLHAAISAAIVFWLRRTAGQAMFSATLQRLRGQPRTEQKPQGSGD